jgi:hypothetical protein
MLLSRFARYVRFLLMHQSCAWFAGGVNPDAPVTLKIFSRLRAGLRYTANLRFAHVGPLT